MLPEETGVVVIANSNYFPGRNGLRPAYIIVHGTAGGSNAEAIANYFASTQGTGNPVSSHYVIGQDGEIVQCVSENDGAWANGILTAGHDSWWNPNINPNNITISIEHCKPAQDNSTPLTQAQQDASFTLIKHICQRWSIPMQAADANGGITGHFSLDPINRRNCPGPYPWDALWAFLKEDNTLLNLNDPVVKTFFTDAGHGAWRCRQNGVVLFGGNLQFYRSNGGPALLGLPLTNEIYLPQYQNTAIVMCERAIIVYDPGRKIDTPPTDSPCYLLHINGQLSQYLLQQYLHINALSAKATSSLQIVQSSPSTNGSTPTQSQAS